AGRALKGPADRLLAELGHESSVAGVAGVLAEVAATLVVDSADAALAGDVEDRGVACVVTSTVMQSVRVAEELARATLAVVR
ncbi:MAG TPA: 2-phospho-L-lactate transferase, partial [Acidimicrobiales bacterium]|nr:2-phospho-L-lactate transferase [Acidimicrobiales bacterium]